jgi:hypothetical protein
MLFSSPVRLLLALPLALLGGPVFAGGPSGTLIAPNLTVPAGHTVTVPILLDNNLGNIQGWSFGLQAEAPLDVLSHALGSTTMALNGGAGPAFYGPSIKPGLGFTVGVVITFMGSEVLPLGSGYEIQTLEIQVPASALPGTVYPLTFTETLGDPAVTNVLVVGGQSFSPELADGSITVGFESFCYCDGSGLAAPCGNFGAAGRGCGNSANSVGAVLTGTGTPSVASSTLELQTSGGTPSVFGVFFQGTQQAGSGVGVFFNDGFLCASGTIKRLEIVALDGAGSASSTVDIAVEGLLPPGGGTRTYQFWYRDPQNSPCNTASNTSNAIEVVWMP